MRAIGDQVGKNLEYLSILDKEAIKNGKIDDKTQVEQVSVMNKLLNDALRAKGYAGPDIKMVLTDVEDPNGPYYTDTLTNTVVFDKTKLANANRNEILNALGHEFGHYSKEDDTDKTQDIANHTGRLLENRTKNMVGKEATEETLAGISFEPKIKKLPILSKFSVGGDLHFSIKTEKTKFGFLGARGSIVPKISKLFNSLDMGKYGVTNVPKVEKHISLDYSYVLWHMEMDEKSFNEYAEIQKANYQPETRVIENTANFLIQNYGNLRRTNSFKEAMDRLNKMYEDGYME